MKQFLKNCWIIFLAIMLFLSFGIVFIAALVSFIAWDSSIWTEIEWMTMLRVFVAISFGASVIGNLFQLDEYFC